MDSGTTFGLRCNGGKGHSVTELEELFNYGTNTGSRNLGYSIKSAHHEDYTCLLDTEAQCNLDSMSEMVTHGWRI